VTNNYWDYPTATDSVPSNSDPQFDTGNSANFFDGDYTTGNFSFPMTDVGAYLQSGSPYGTFDQGGNVAEWNETMFPGIFASVRGGDWGEHPSGMHPSIYWVDIVPTDEINLVGFRLASIPEPASFTLSLAGVAMLSLRRHRS
jgi:formylglycine-generating enzyme